MLFASCESVLVQCYASYAHYRAFSERARMFKTKENPRIMLASVPQKEHEISFRPRTFPKWIPEILTFTVSEFPKNLKRVSLGTCLKMARPATLPFLDTKSRWHFLYDKRGEFEGECRMEGGWRGGTTCIARDTPQVVKLHDLMKNRLTKGYSR